MSGGATSIDDLPVGGSDENVVLQTTENVIVDSKVEDVKRQRDADLAAAKPQENEVMDMNEFVSGIQKASASGALSLQHRDVPLDQTSVTRDESVKPNFVPTSTTSDYITEHQTSEEIIRQNAKKQEAESTIDRLAAELGVPVMIAALYFMYQLPVVRRTFLKTFPMCYGANGNLNLSGYVVNSVIFGAIIFGSHKIVQQLSV